MKKLNPLLLCIAFSVCPAAAQSVNLHSLVNFAALAGSTLTNTGPTIVNNGDIGVSPGTAITGFPPGTVVGGVTHIHSNDGPAATAQGDLTTAYGYLAGLPATTIVAGDLGGQTLILPGVYKSTSSLGITGVLTLNGTANSVYVFQIASALTTATGSQVVLTGGLTAANVFWQVGSSATLGTYSIFNGTIMAQASVSVATGAVLNGRALARTGAVTMDTNSMVNPGAVVTGPVPPVLSGFTCPVGTALVGVAYNSFVVPTGGTAPYAFSVTSGSLPPGAPAFSLNASSGDLTGTPTGVTAPYIFGVRVTDSASGSASASCTINVTAPTDQAILAITKSGPTPPTVPANTNFSYTIVVTNTGPSPANNVTVTDILPAGTTFVSATSPCAAALGIVTCNLTTPLAAVTGSATFTVVVTSPNSSGSFDNTATVVSTTPSNTANSHSTYTVAVPGPSVPALSTWGLAVLALLLLLAGYAARFGRKAQA